jgi:ketosteroid isomerase-like protein
MSGPELVRRLFTAAETNDVNDYVSHFTDDAVYQVGNNVPAIGPPGIRALVPAVQQAVESVRHDIQRVWEQPDTVICQLEVVYRRKDGEAFRLPCLTVVRLRGDKVQHYQAFLDTSPVFAAPQRSIGAVPPASRRVETIDAMRLAYARRDWDSFRSLVTDDVLYRPGAVAEVKGPRALWDYLDQIYGGVRISKMTPRGIWEADDVVIYEYEMQITYTKDNRSADFPCVDIFQFRGDTISGWRVYPLHPSFVAVKL